MEAMNGTLCPVAPDLSICFIFFCPKRGAFGGMFGMLKGLVGSKSLSQEDMEPVLDKMRDHLIGMDSSVPHYSISLTHALPYVFI